jgi:hypothetical protein
MAAPSLALAPSLAPVPEPKRPKLLEYLDDIEAVLDTLDGLDEADEESRDALGRMLIEKIAGTKAKIDSSCHVLAGFAAAEASAKAERDRLDARAKYFARQTDRLETYLLAVLEASKQDRIDGNTCGIQRRKNPAKVRIDCEQSIPFDFLRFPPEPPPPPAQPDKKLIAAALKANPDACPGATLVNSFRLVRT